MVSGQTYRIGSVSRLTGVPADTLRVWERRYHAVIPVRSDAGTRLYASEDVGRLTLIKRLVDRGDAISRVANLTLEGLRERMRGADLPERLAMSERPCQVVVRGPYLAARLRQEAGTLAGLEFTGFFSSTEDFLAASFDPTPDVAVFEFPTIHGDQIPEIRRLFAHSRAARAILIYGFASRSVVESLDSPRMMTRRAPVDSRELSAWCLSARAQPWACALEDDSAGGMGVLLPRRRFSDVDLARLAAAAGSGDCECSGPLVDLVATLAAFESFTGECAIRAPDESALETYLHACAARARALLELALERAARASGLDVDGKD
nr:MerR family transcriptional regulator [Thiocystis violacea]